MYRLTLLPYYVGVMRREKRLTERVLLKKCRGITTQDRRTAITYKQNSS